MILTQASFSPIFEGLYKNYQSVQIDLTLKLPEKLQLYGLYVYFVVHICDFGMLRVKYVNIYC